MVHFGMAMVESSRVERRVRATVGATQRHLFCFRLLIMNVVGVLREPYFLFLFFLMPDIINVCMQLQKLCAHMCGALVYSLVGMFARFFNRMQNRPKGNRMQRLFMGGAYHSKICNSFFFLVW